MPSEVSKSFNSSVSALNLHLFYSNPVKWREGKPNLSFINTPSIIYPGTTHKASTHLPLVSVNWVSIGSDNGISPIRHQAIISTSAGLLSIGHLGTNFSEILSKIKKLHQNAFENIVCEMAAILSRGDELTQHSFFPGHQPIHPESCEPKGMCWNYDSVLSVIYKYHCVSVYACGHDHAGGMHRDDHGILHLTLPGVVEARPGENDFGTVYVYTDRMELHGHGRVPSMKLAEWGP